MTWLAELWRRVTRLVARDRYTGELEEEIRSHLAMRADEFRSTGVEHETAVRAARARFGNVAELTEQSRESWGGVWLEQRLQDARIAARGLRRTPGFTAAAVLTIALGVAAATSVITVAEGVLFAPLPVQNADRVVVLYGHNPNKQPEHFPLSGGEYTALARETHALSMTAAVEYHGAAVGFLHLGDTVVTLRGAGVTGSFFDVVGARPILGRLLTPDDDRNIVPTPMVISERFWQRAFGRDTAIVGRVLQLGLTRVKIVGVADARLDYPRGSEIWFSFRSRFPPSDTLPGFHDVIGRLAPHMTARNAEEELGAFLARPEEPHSGARLVVGHLEPVARPIRDEIVGDIRPVLAIVAAAVGLLLVVTCVNVANLLLVRMLARRREFALRAALGAGRQRIGQYVLIECAVLSLMGGTLGVLVAWNIIRVFAATAPLEVPRAHTLTMDGRALAASIVLCVLITVLFGCVPAITSAGVSLTSDLKERRQGDGTAHGRLRGALVATQVATAVVMLVAATVVARGFDAIAHRRLGLQPEHLIIARLAQTATVGDAMAWKSAVSNAIGRIRQLPGVGSAAGLTEPPFSDAGNDLGYTLPADAPGAAINRPFVEFLGADQEYFQTLGIHVERGRVFTSEDRIGTPLVAVVDELLARQAWSGRDPIGQQIGVGTVYYTVVGVVSPTRYRNLLAPRATLYTDYVQSPVMSSEYIWAPYYVAVRSSLDPARLIAQLQGAVHESDARLFLADASTLGDRIDDNLAVQRLGAVLLDAFALSVLLLTMLGLYSVAATFVRYREFEIGVRMALGATPMGVRAMVMRQAVPLIACGAAVGAIGALFAGVRLSGMVAGGAPPDAFGINAAIAVVCVVATAAFAIPARRAARANPADVLRAG